MVKRPKLRATIRGSRNLNGAVRTGDRKTWRLLTRTGMTMDQPTALRQSRSSSASASPAASTSYLPSAPSPAPFDVIGTYRRALTDDQVPHPVAAISALTELIEASTASTLTGLLAELVNARQRLITTQASLGVRAGCQLFERFVGFSGGGEDYASHKRGLITQGRHFCSITAPECRDRIARLAVGFLRDDATILTHGYSRTVVQAILRAHKQHKRVKVYVTETRPTGLGLRTHQVLTAAGIPCTVVLDSAVAYIMERVDLVLVGSEAVVESGGLVSGVGTYQTALVAKALQKPFYALAESYKFLRYYPLSQTDLPAPVRAVGQAAGPPLTFPPSYPSHDSAPPLSRLNSTAPATPTRVSSSPGQTRIPIKYEMSKEMEDANPLADVTTPDLIDLIITDLGALSPEAVSQYLVAQFSS